jgi:hypothetical protein
VDDPVHRLDVRKEGVAEPLTLQSTASHTIQFGGAAEVQLRLMREYERSVEYDANDANRERGFLRSAFDKAGDVYYFEVRLHFALRLEVADEPVEALIRHVDARLHFHISVRSSRRRRRRQRSAGPVADATTLEGSIVQKG